MLISKAADILEWKKNHFKPNNIPLRFTFLFPFILTAFWQLAIYFIISLVFFIIIANRCDIFLNLIERYFFVVVANSHDFTFSAPICFCDTFNF